MGQCWVVGNDATGLRLKCPSPSRGHGEEQNLGGCLVGVGVGRLVVQDVNVSAAIHYGGGLGDAQKRLGSVLAQRQLPRGVRVGVRENGIAGNRCTAQGEQESICHCKLDRVRRHGKVGQGCSTGGGLRVGDQRKTSGNRVDLEHGNVAARSDEI